MLSQSDPDPTLALCLAGGGGLGFSHVGLFQAMEELGIRPGIICGTSSGAVLGAFYAAGYTAQETRERLKSFTWTRIVAPPFSKRGIASTDRMQRFFRKQIGVKNIEDLPIRLKVAAININNGTLVGFDSGPLGKCLAASSAIPGFFEPVRIGNGVYYDAGGIYNLPLELLAGEGVKTIIAGNTIGKYGLIEKPKTVQDVLYQAYFIRTMHLTATRLGPAGWIGKQDEDVIFIDYKTRGCNPGRISESPHLIDETRETALVVLERAIKDKRL